MSLEKVNWIYQGSLVCSVMQIGGITDYLDKIKENIQIDQKEKWACFYLKNDGQVITKSIDGKFLIMCKNLSEEVANELKGLVK